MQMKKLLNKVLLIYCAHYINLIPVFLIHQHQLQVLHAVVPTPIKELGKHRVINYSLGPTHSAFLVEAGHVYSFGRNSEGQLGVGDCAVREMASIVRCGVEKPIVSNKYTCFFLQIYLSSST